ncbi:hypothetical protein Sjap_014378 [Stephania japonica]|uniref:Uncharacterized protein n=1 Tax=Stephania japonica TaxID=461633 RepID=A0AAP0IZS4_9MAGN
MKLTSAIRESEEVDLHLSNLTRKFQPSKKKKKQRSEDLAITKKKKNQLDEHEERPR